MNSCQTNLCPHCESPYLEGVWIEVCKVCGEPEAHEVSLPGEGCEGLTVCDACGSIEGGYKDALTCPNCERIIEAVPVEQRGGQRP